MNYTECFNRSRAAICLQPVFLFFAPVLVPSLASGMEYCHGCTFAPVWCPRWHQAWSIATDAHLRPLVPSLASEYGVLPRMHICARLVPSLASGMEYCHGCTFAPVLVPYSIMLHTLWKIIDFRVLQRCPPLQGLVIDIIEYYRYWGIVNECE